MVPMGAATVAVVLAALLLPCASPIRVDGRHELRKALSALQEGRPCDEVRKVCLASDCKFALDCASACKGADRVGCVLDCRDETSSDAGRQALLAYERCAAQAAGFAVSPKATNGPESPRNATEVGEGNLRFKRRSRGDKGKAVQVAVPATQAAPPATHQDTAWSADIGSHQLPGTGGSHSTHAARADEQRGAGRLSSWHRPAGGHFQPTTNMMHKGPDLGAGNVGQGKKAGEATSVSHSHSGAAPYTANEVPKGMENGWNVMKPQNQASLGTKVNGKNELEAVARANQQGSNTGIGFIDDIADLLNNKKKDLSPTFADLEACTACIFVWEKVKEDVGEAKQTTPDAVTSSFETICQDMPDVFYEGCDDMMDQAGWLSEMYMDGKETTGICDKSGICGSSGSAALFEAGKGMSAGEKAKKKLMTGF